MTLGTGQEGTPMERLISVGGELALEFVDDSGRRSTLFYLSCQPDHGSLDTRDHRHNDFPHDVDRLGRS